GTICGMGPCERRAECVDGVESECVPGLPGVEVCNNIDDDCDGTTDEDAGVQCGAGACARRAACVDGVEAECVPGLPGVEVCNDVDDDCDGMTDEGLAGTTCGVGACLRHTECVGGVEVDCVPGLPGVEICNEADEDCDDLVDEDFLGEVVITAYSTLGTFVGGCNGSGAAAGQACRSAIKRFCDGRRCRHTGFGPVESAGDTAEVICLAGRVDEWVTWATLGAQNVACDGVGERDGPNCNAAIHRWCANRGLVSGFGPVEVGPGAGMFAVCVGPRAEVRGTTYAVLSAHNRFCDGNGQRIGLECNNAIHLWCRAQGFVSGFGPVESSGGDVAVTCVRD
ncbi:MAG: hypothetical protein KC620_26020, partial [Myxococcales bacterium]|nr:hypothetical protein [Myxococcales bacterium]